MFVLKFGLVIYIFYKMNYDVFIKYFLVWLYRLVMEYYICLLGSNWWKKRRDYSKLFFIVIE